LLDRNEWETELKGGKPDFSAVRHTALEPLLTKKRRRQLHPVFETRVRRTTYPLTLGGSEIEVTLDRGEIGTGDRSKPLCEIEIESKAGETLPNLPDWEPDLPKNNPDVLVATTSALRAHLGRKGGPK
jgi:inorganic triphosphatase YgiF